MLCRKNNGNGNKTAFGEDDIGPVEFYQLQSLAIAFYNAEWVGEIFDVKISAEFTGGDTIIGNTHSFDEFPFDSLIGSNVTDLIAMFFQRWNQSKVRGNMSGCSAASYPEPCYDSISERTWL